MLMRLGQFMCPKKTALTNTSSDGGLSSLNPEWELLPANFDSGSGKYLNSVSSPASGALQSDYDTTPINSITVANNAFVFGTGARLDQINTNFMNELHHYDSTNLNIGHPWTIFMRGIFTLSSTVYFLKTKGAGEGVRIRIISSSQIISGHQENTSSQSQTFDSVGTVTASTDTTLIISWDPSSGTIRYYIGDTPVEEFDPLWYDANGTAQSNNQIQFSPGTEVKSIGMLRHFIDDSDATTIKNYLNSL